VGIQATLPAVSSPTVSEAAVSQRSGEDLAASAFLDKLSLAFIERLWVAIKKNCMLGAASGRTSGVQETINLLDLLRLCSQQMAQHTAEDEHFLGQLFHRVDRRRKGAIRTTDIATALVLICNEDAIPKLKTLFRVFDADDDSCLTLDEIFDMYLSIKVNDITRTKEKMVADAAFDDELSLQEAKRLYELTVEHLKAVSDFVIFDEFKLVFNERCVGAFLLENLLPGAFSLDWILSRDLGTPNLESRSLLEANRYFVGDVRRGLVEALRRGEEHLDLSRRRGRGTRIMQSCLSSAPHRAGDVSPPPGGSGYTTPGGSSMGVGGSASSPAHRDLPRLRRAGPPVGKFTPRSGGRPGTDRSQRPALTNGPAQHGQCLDTGQSQAQGANPGQSQAQGPAQGQSQGQGQGQGQVDGSRGRGAAASGPCEAGDARRGAQDEAEDDSDSDDDGIGASTSVIMGRSGGYGLGRGGAPGGTTSRSSGRGLLQVEHENFRRDELKEVLTLNHKNARRFRSMMLDEKTQQAYLRDKTDVGRAMRYQCLVCAVNHDLKLSKLAGGAEHQHSH